ncbi:glycosyltransferase family 2 protein [Dyella choica]|uniref:glycosyltransferase family 2 protein n=1 Tax=Dyella choica TaxID=1927959 RepID=UPI0013153748|nr:glycosyltransferase family 2 protein [Dyella choica]
MANTGRTNNVQGTDHPPSARIPAIRHLHPPKIGDTAPVSVVVPCFRCAHTIAHAVASVAAQMLPPAEVLLVEDGSDDGTLEQLHRVAHAYPPGWVKVIAMPLNSGPSAARNRGWESASQPWIAFLDADDMWHPQKLKLQMEALAKDPQIALIAHDMNVQSRSAPAPALKTPLKVRVFPRHLMMLRSSFPTASIMLRRELPFRFDETRWRAEDFMLWAQILLSGYRCAKLNQVLASWHKPPFGAGGLSGDMAAMYEAAGSVRKALHEQGLLNGWQWRLGEAMSLIRYLRRRVITFKRRHQGLFLAGRNA